MADGRTPNAIVVSDQKGSPGRTLLKNEKNPPVFRPFQCRCGLVFPPTAGFTAPDAGSRRQPDISAIGGQRRFAPARLCLLGVFVCRIDAAFPAQYCGSGICRQSRGIMGGLRLGLFGYRPLDSRGIRLSAAPAGGRCGKPARAVSPVCRFETDTGPALMSDTFLFNRNQAV